MSSKKKNIPVQATASVKSLPKTDKIFVADNSIVEQARVDNFFSKLTSSWVPYFIIIALGFALYANTFHHQFALDDDIIICKNENVLKGLDGIPEIMKTDALSSFYKSINLTDQLSGGRYRPFSIATYAIEQEFIGTLPNGLTLDAWDMNHNKIQDPNEDVDKDGLWTPKDFKVRGTMLRHVDNVLLYILSICLIYLFLSRFFFKENKLLALFTALLFLAHPLHTEVVANMKSRDEILSLLFIVLTLYFSFLYVEMQKKKYMWFALITYFVALLSKEYGASLLLIVPLGLYVYYKNLKFTDILFLMFGMFITFGIYYSIRSSTVMSIGDDSLQNSDLLNNPYLLATEGQALATKIFINLKYFALLLYPVMMSSDYGYNTIPFKDFASLEVIASILLLAGAGIGLVIAFRKRNWLAFPIAFYLLHLFMVNNTFFNIGATMGERLVYHSSFGICILMVYGLYFLSTKVKLNSNLIAVVVLPIIVLYSLKTIARNPAWENDTTLSLTDVQTHPNSILLNGNACIHLIEISEFPKNKALEYKYLDSAAEYGKKAIFLFPKFVNGYTNLGMINFKKGQVDSAAKYWDKVIELFPTHPNVPQIRQFLSTQYTNKANDMLNQQNTTEGLNYLLKAYKYIPENPSLCYNIGRLYMAQQNSSMAKLYWSKGLQYSPTDQALNSAMQSLGGN
jgi:hypothetical protein